MNHCSDKEKLLYEISVLDFVVVDFAEYLDTHPKDTKALEYFKHYNKLRKKACEEFAAKYYPLTIYEASSYNDEFRWAYAPLPWE